VSFQQTSSDCQQTQQQSVQAREQDTLSLAYRDVGLPQIQTRSVVVTQTRASTGTRVGTSIEYLIRTGYWSSSWQSGYIQGVRTGVLMSISDTNYPISYLTTNSGGLVTFNGFADPTAIQYVLLETLDGSYNVTRSVRSSAYVYKSGLMTFQDSTSGYIASYNSTYLRFTVVLK
jgi:hypothetical protein